MTHPADEDGLALLSPAMRGVAERGAERRYRRGALLIQEGDPGGTLYFIVRGRLRAYAASADGQEFTYGIYGAGEYMGELSLDGGPRSANVIVEQAAVCRIVTRQTLEQCIAERPELAFELLAKVIHRARNLSTRARDLALGDAYSRLVPLLRDAALPQPDGTRWMPVALTQEQLAQQVGCSRTMVTKLLGDLVRGGYLRQDQRRWRLLRPLPPRW
ncbi:Crp/Fnr family transcriptional regulator [Rubrivivax sp. A210]|uniref:Crp/Fnr family transcriptional regulator n=1 Tax=Rubrivivax sp. A210 TaxID=2772301 RepID=UPI00191805A7|nr:Crp/Fnr family transcriptional regulator [Rubrivivax sp. A210]